MRVAITEHHLRLHKSLVNEINKRVKKFGNKSYSKIESIEHILLKKNISVEKKKEILAKELHSGITNAFSINKKKLSNAAFDSLKKKIINLRKIIIKLRSINYYLETTFLNDLKHLKFKFGDKMPKINSQDDLARDELETLEYTTYKLIEEAVVLDKRLLSEYSHKAEAVSMKESAEMKDISIILGKESVLLQHLEAKLPPPNSMTRELVKEPSFTHWVSRIFALLLCFEWLLGKESLAFTKLKKNKLVKAKISKKITHLIKERSKLVRIMQEKAASIKKFRIGNELKGELHNFTTIINI